MKQWKDLNQKQKSRIILGYGKKKEKEYKKRIPDRVTSLEIKVMDLQNDIKKILGELERLHESIDF